MFCFRYSDSPFSKDDKYGMYGPRSEDKYSGSKNSTWEVEKKSILDSTVPFKESDDRSDLTFDNWYRISLSSIPFIHVGSVLALVNIKLQVHCWLSWLIFFEGRESTPKSSSVIWKINRCPVMLFLSLSASKRPTFTRELFKNFTSSPLFGG